MFAREPALRDTGDRLYGFAALGQKFEWMRANPLSCVEADEVFASNNWRGVVVLGRIEELTDKPESDEVRRQAQEMHERRRCGGRRLTRRRSRGVVPKPARPVFYCIHIDDLSGNNAVPNAVEAPFVQKLQRPVRPPGVTAGVTAMSTQCRNVRFSAK